jgi:hypothetical protein
MLTGQFSKSSEMIFHLQLYYQNFGTTFRDKASAVFFNIWDKDECIFLD